MKKEEETYQHVGGIKQKERSKTWEHCHETSAAGCRSPVQSAMTACPARGRSSPPRSPSKAVPSTHSQTGHVPATRSAAPCPSSRTLQRVWQHSLARRWAAAGVQCTGCVGGAVRHRDTYLPSTLIIMISHVIALYPMKIYQQSYLMQTAKYTHWKIHGLIQQSFTLSTNTTNVALYVHTARHMFLLLFCFLH